MSAAEAIHTGPQILSGSTPKPFPVLICGGFAVLGVLGILDAANVEGFDLHIFNEPQEGYVPETSPIQNPGYGEGVAIDNGPQISFIDDGEGMTREERLRLVDELRSSGIAPGGARFGLIVTSPQTIAEVLRALDAVNNHGADPELVKDSLSPDARGVLSSSFERYRTGTNIVVSDRKGTMVIRFFKNSGISSVFKGSMN